MKKLLFCVLSLSLAAAVLAAEAKKPLTDAEKAALREKRLMKTGGIVTREGKGKLLIVNAQQKVSAGAIEKQLGTFRDFLNVKIEVRPGTWKMGESRPADANAVVYVVDDAALPMSLVAMEAGWGVVNIAPLGGDARRFDREFMRVAIATFGAGVSQYAVSPMQPVCSPEDLDSLVGADLTMDAGVGMRANLEKRGVTASKMTTYRKACQEGWAAAPTNDYQKVVWEQVKAETNAKPSNPIKIVKEKK